MSDEFTWDFAAPLSMEVEFTSVDPEILALLTGATVTAAGFAQPEMTPTFALEVHQPGRRRTFWEWLRRKPKHLPRTFYIPNARLGEPE